MSDYSVSYLSEIPPLNLILHPGTFQPAFESSDVSLQSSNFPCHLLSSVPQRLAEMSGYQLYIFIWPWELRAGWRWRSEGHVVTEPTGIREMA